VIIRVVECLRMVIVVWMFECFKVSCSLEEADLAPEERRQRHSFDCRLLTDVEVKLGLHYLVP